MGTVIYTSAQSQVIQKNIHDPILSHQEGSVVGGIGLGSYRVTNEVEARFFEFCCGKHESILMDVWNSGDNALSP